MWKKIAIVGLYLVTGFILGSSISIVYATRTMAQAMFMFQETEIFELEEAAEQAYHNQPNEVAVWALENYINALNRLKEQRSSAKVENLYIFPSTAQSSLLAHARLGKLYKKMNELEKSKYHFEQAISYSDLAG
jgi:hypothetical protein